LNTYIDFCRVCEKNKQIQINLKNDNLYLVNKSVCMDCYTTTTLLYKDCPQCRIYENKLGVYPYSGHIISDSGFEYCIECVNGFEEYIEKKFNAPFRLSTKNLKSIKKLTSITIDRVNLSAILKEWIRFHKDNQ
jgi:ribosomal protein L40E